MKTNDLPAGAPEPGAQKQGRPSVYTEELGARICELLAEGMSLNAICKRDDVPVAESTVRSWALDAEHPFSANYARGKEIGFHKLADETLDIADAEATEPGQVARDRLRVDTRKWLLSKVLPKIYGDRLAIGGDPETGPVKHIVEHVYVRPDGNKDKGN